MSKEKTKKKTKNKKGRGVALVFTVLLTLFVVASTLSFFNKEFIHKAALAIADETEFQAGNVKRDTRELAIVLQDGETAALNELPNLAKADLRGSECVDEILSWSEAHPAVEVIYDVALPSGTVIDNEETVLNFTGIDHDNLESYISKLKYFPKAAEVELGSDRLSESALTPEDLAALVSDHPELKFYYEMNLMGQSATLEEECLDLSALKALDRNEFDAALAYLPAMKNLSEIKLGDEANGVFSWEDIEKIKSACPEANLRYSFKLYGKAFTLDDEIIDINHIKADDKGAAAVKALKCMNNCTTLDMDYCGVSNEDMEKIRKQFPDVDVIWRIWFGTNYSVRTDEERILASKPSVGGVIYDEDAKKLAYCTKVKYLDLGHNEVLTDISFVESMPDLEVFIIAMNPLEDISPLAKCPKLEYLELNSTNVSDLTPLSEAKELRHLNIASTQVDDLKPIYGLSDMERLWIGSLTPLTTEQIDEFRPHAPKCVINTTVSVDPTGESWRYTGYDENIAKYYWVPRYEELRNQLGYNGSRYSYYWKDEKCGDPCPEEYKGTADGMIMNF